MTIPASVTYIGLSAFFGCSLNAAYFLGNAPLLWRNVFVANASDFIVYYTLGSTGFSNPWYTQQAWGQPPGVHAGECYIAGIQSGDFLFDTYNGKVRIVKYIGSGGAVVIPDTIEGMPVNSIGGGTTTGSTFFPSWHWGAFSGCTGVTSITMPSSVTHISDYAFSGCTGLTSVSMPSSLTWIGELAFSGCTALTSIDIPASVTSICAAAFEGCTGLTSITIPGSATYLGQYVFKNCTGLLSATIPDGITAIAVGMFYNCTGLTSMTIPDSVTSLGGSAFGGCTGLTSVTIPGNVTSIGGSAFFGCTGLSTVTIPGSVTSIEWLAFAGCSGLTSIHVDARNSAYSSQDGVLYNKNRTALIQYPAEKTGGVHNSRRRYEYWVWCFLSLQRIDQRYHTRQRYVTIWFFDSYCSGLYQPWSFILSGWRLLLTSDLEDKSFYNCENLTSVYFEGNAPNIDHDNFACYPTDLCCGYAEYGPFYCASGFTVYYRAGATGFTNPWCFAGAGDDCYPALVYGESSTTTTTITTTTVPAESCTVEFFPAG